MTPKEKKNDKIELRISDTKKAAFISLCELNDTNVTDALTKYIDTCLSEVKKHAKKKAK
jgi:hypothetical protein